MRRPLEWQIASLKAIKPETPTVKTFTLAPPYWSPHRAGQHVDVRLVAPDGYQAQRSYSIASEPERAGEVDLTVERLEDGEVSSYLHDVLIVGDQLELRGPIGGYFVWEARLGGPLLLIAGGSGVVPLMAMIRHRRASGSSTPARLLYSSRSIEDVIYREELDRLAAAGDGLDVRQTLTRSQPAGWQGYARRIDRDMLREVAWPRDEAPLVYVCGPTSFAESAADILVELGYDPLAVRIERFGATGG